MSNELENLFKKGTPISEQLSKYEDFSIISLRVSLQSYFETYEAINRHLENVKCDDSDCHPKYSIKYIEAYAKAIIHAHHFSELVIKHILREIHPLLPLRTDNEHEIVYNLLFKPTIDEKLDNVKTLEFSDSLKRLCALVKANVLKSSGAELINKNKDLFEKLNHLRNRIWHRGKFILHHNALDELFGYHLLVILPQLVSVYKDISESSWKYEKLDCGLDPINELVREWNGKNNKPNVEKIALLKEMARAAYHIPDKLRKVDIVYAQEGGKPLVNIPGIKVDFSRWLEKEREGARQLEEQKAEAIHHSKKDEKSFDIKNCPVCGICSLLRFDDFVDGESDKIPCTLHIIYRAECNCCGFNIEFKVGDPSDYGYLNIPTIFEVTPIPPVMHTSK